MLVMENDYSRGAHPSVLRRLAETNGESMPGYGTDPLCASAAARIRDLTGDPDDDVMFLVGGTQTNQTVLDVLTPPYAGVAAADCGHISTHEAGAIEATGRKVIALPAHGGRLDADDLDRLCSGLEGDPNGEHMVSPGSVYLSHPTEYGTLYTLRQLEAISSVCRRHGIPLYVDGARLGYGLAAKGTDVTPRELDRLTDAFTIGGTKVGALFGEAVVFPRHGAPAHLTTRVKRRGALLAKGWLLGLQFDTLLSDDLYMDISRNADDRADEVRAALDERGYGIEHRSTTNQIFVSLDAGSRRRLERGVVLGFLGREPDGNSLMRICTSWATTPDDVRRLVELL